MNQNQKNNHDGVAATMDRIADAAPFITFLIACLSFALITVFKTDYYTTVFSERWMWWPALAAGVIAGIATEGSRAILLVLTFRDFRNSNQMGGFLGLLLSFGLVAYDCFSAGPVSSLWTGGHAVTIGPIIRDIVVFLVVLSCGLELRLALSTRGRDKDNNTKQQESQPDNTQSQTGNNSPVNSNPYTKQQAVKGASNGSPNIYNETKEQSEQPRTIGFKQQAQHTPNPVTNSVPALNITIVNGEPTVPYTKQNGELKNATLADVNSWLSTYKNRTATANNLNKIALFEQMKKQLEEAKRQ